MTPIELHAQRVVELEYVMLMMRLGVSMPTINAFPVCLVAIVAPTAGGVA